MLLQVSGNQKSSLEFDQDLQQLDLFEVWRKYKTYNEEYYLHLQLKLNLYFVTLCSVKPWVRPETTSKDQDSKNVPDGQAYLTPLERWETRMDDWWSQEKSMFHRPPQIPQELQWHWTLAF
jgi:hypothetical protein